MSGAVFQPDVADVEKTESQSTDETVGEMASVETPGDAARDSTAASETNARQTKPKKMNKKQLLAEQRRKDRVCTELSAMIKCVTNSLYNSM